MRINHNIAALNTYRQLSANSSLTQKNMEKLSSGMRINKAADDAAGLVVSEKMRAQIRGLDQASRNAQDGISLIQTAEGALSETHSILNRMRELAVQSSNGTLKDEDRTEIQKEINQLTEELDRIATTTDFNTKKLIDGSVSDNAKKGAFSNGEGTALAGVAVNSYASIGTSTVHVVSVADKDYGTKTAASNLTDGTNTATGDTTLGSLTFNSDTNLGLTNGDTITISMKAAGEDINIEYKITDASTETYQNLVDTINEALGNKGNASIDTNTGALTIEGAVGRDNAITDVSIKAKSSDGAARNIFNSALTFTQTQVAANSEDAVLNVGNDEVSNNSIAVGKGSVVKDTLIDGVTLTMGTDFTVNDTFSITVSKSDQSLSMHIGANENQTMDVSINDMGARALGVRNSDGTAVNVNSVANAEKAITTIDNAIKQVSAERSKLGSYQNRLEHTINNLSTISENLTSAESRIRDVDMAKEMMEFTKNNILNQAAQAMLAQANQQPQAVLQLLR